jgi:hypothetical protein
MLRLQVSRLPDLASRLKLSFHQIVQGWTGVDMVRIWRIPGVCLRVLLVALTVQALAPDTFTLALLEHIRGSDHALKTLSRFEFGMRTDSPDQDSNDNSEPLWTELVVVRCPRPTFRQGLGTAPAWRQESRNLYRDSGHRAAWSCDSVGLADDLTRMLCRFLC